MLLTYGLVWNHVTPCLIAGFPFPFLCVNLESESSNLVTGSCNTKSLLGSCHNIVSAIQQPNHFPSGGFKLDKAQATLSFFQHELLLLTCFQLCQLSTLWPHPALCVPHCFSRKRDEVLPKHMVFTATLSWLVSKIATMKRQCQFFIFIPAAWFILVGVVDTKQKQSRGHE